METKDIVLLFSSLSAIVISLGGFFVKSRVQLTERQQARADSEQKFQQDIQLRQVEALEQIGKVLVSVDLRLARVEANQERMTSGNNELLRRSSKKKVVAN